MVGDGVGNGQTDNKFLTEKKLKPVHLLSILMTVPSFHCSTNFFPLAPATSLSAFPASVWEWEQGKE